METSAAVLNPSKPRRWVGLWWWPATLLAMAVAAFFPTYFGRFPGFAGTSATIHFHVATMLAWVALTITQPILIHRRRFELHRRLGSITYLLLPVIAFGFWLVMRDGQLRRKEPELILATAFDAFFYFFLVTMGLFCRKRRAYHGAFMMLSLLPFLNPTLGRLTSPAVSVTVELVLLITLLIRARRKHREFKPYVIALTAFLGAVAALGVVMGAFPTAAERLWRTLFA